MSNTGKRRTDRVSISMPVTVSGTDAAGKPFSEHASTVTVSQFGAAIAVKSLLTPGQDITILRSRSGTVREAKCQVLGQIATPGEPKIFTVAFHGPAVGFWDIYFPALPADNETAGRVFVMCRTCGTRRIVHLNAAQLTSYETSHRVSHPCETCGKSTVWVESQQPVASSPELKVANPARLAPAPAPAARENQRKHRRLQAEIPVCIRQAGTDDEVATSVDISRGGLCFISRRAYPAGTYIQVAIPFSPTAVNVFVEARVVHTFPMLSGDLYRHGVMYLAEHAALS